MHSPLIAIVLCLAAQASFACLPAADQAAQGGTPIRAHVVRAQATGGELITTASATTKRGAAAPATRSAPLPGTQTDPEHPRRAGPAMLLAALALMSGIALRRYSAGSR